MKRITKYVALGLIVLMMLLSTVMGAQVRKSIEVVYNSVNLTVNGNKIEADNILYEGTTYVPIRAVAEALGKEVGWDQATYTASINDPGQAAPSPTPTPAPTPAPAPQGETLSQQNAVKKAESYLSWGSFSRSGLIDQLEFEGFSKAEASYAVDKLNVDWRQQAVKKAESYLSWGSFSRSGLIDQLEFEGFSKADATYAADQVGF